MTLLPCCTAAAIALACSTSFAQADDFSRCLADLKPAAQAAGVRGETFDRHTQGLASDLTVIDKLNFQPEFKTPIWDYLAGLVDEERVANFSHERKDKRCSFL